LSPLWLPCWSLSKIIKMITQTVLMHNPCARKDLIVSYPFFECAIASFLFVLHVRRDPFDMQFLYTMGWCRLSG
jgi:hypothetical protein